MDEAVKRIVERLGLAPHPEGGFFREIFRSGMAVAHPLAPAGEEAWRAAGTAIYFLLPAGDFSAFHRVRSDETWHFYGGDPLELHLIHPGGAHERRLLAGDLAVAEPATTVEAGCWQAARVAAGGAWSLVGCTVAPGFDFADFEMPPAADLLELFPQHAELIRQLARG
jgi:uncharacterized protein